MAVEPQPFGPWLLVERLRGARETFRAVRRDAEQGAADTPAVAIKPMAHDRGRPGRSAALPGLFHVNLAAPLELGEADGRPFLVSQLVDGRSLEALLRAGPLSLAASLHVAAEVARGLAFLHRVRVDGVGLVHRRVGPRTVLLTRGGQVVLCALDQAVAPPPRDSRVRVADPERRLRAPEQFVGEPVDPRTDVHGLGMLLRACLGDRRLHGDDGGGGDGAPWLPTEVGRLIARCVSVERAARPDAAEVLARLSELLLEVPQRVGRTELAAVSAERWAVVDEEAVSAPELLDDGEPGRLQAGARSAGRLPRAIGAPGRAEAPSRQPEQPPLGDESRDAGEAGGRSPAPHLDGSARSTGPGTRPERGAGPAHRGGWRRAVAAASIVSSLALAAAAVAAARSPRPAAPHDGSPPLPYEESRGDAVPRISPREDDAVLLAVARSICSTPSGGSTVVNPADERALASPRSAGGDGAARARALLTAIRDGEQVVDAAAERHLADRAAAGTHGLAVLRLLGGESALLLEERLGDLAAPGAPPPGSFVTPSLRRLCDRRALAEALLDHLRRDAAEPTDRREAVDRTGAAGRRAAILGAYLESTPRGRTALAGGLGLSVIAARCATGTLEATLRVSNPTAQPVALPLALLRVGGAAPDSVRPAITPDLRTIPPDSIRDLAIAAPLSPALRRYGATLELPGASLAACAELLP